jgi:hypothetical protein
MNRFLESFKATKAYLIRSGKDDAKYYKNNTLDVLSKKLETIDKNGQEEHTHFSKNEMKIMDIFYNVYKDNDTFTTADKMTQNIYKYIYERFYQNDEAEAANFMCLCEKGECCRKCCKHPGEVCVWNSRCCVEDNDNSMMNWNFGIGKWRC